MIELIGFWASFIAGLTLISVCLLGIRAFWWRALHGQPGAGRMLAAAIVVGFMGAGLNTLYWQVFGQYAIATGEVSLATVHLVGSYLDVPLKLMPATAILMHLAAWRRSLPEDERKNWTLLGMAFYPTRTGLLSKALNSFSEAVVEHKREMERNKGKTKCVLPQK